MSKPILLTPGPVHTSTTIEQAMMLGSMALNNQDFIILHQKVLVGLRKLFKSTNPADQAIVINGNGTLGWEITAHNLVYPGDNVLVVSTGFWADEFSRCLKTYDAHVDVITAPLGDVVPIGKVEEALKSKKYSVIAMAHVDTSVGVLIDLDAIGKVVKKVSPETLIVADGVCSVGVENIEFTNWGCDYILSACQKGLGLPAGLSIGFMSERAIKRSLERPAFTSYLMDMKKWIPIMQAWESGKPKFFTTPSVPLMNALRVALEEILDHGIDIRYAKIKQTSDKFKKGCADLGLSLVPVRPEIAANGLTTVYFPEGIDGSRFLSVLLEKGVAVATGIHHDLIGKYFRVGHMAASAVDDELEHMDLALKAMKETIEELKQ